MFRHWNAGRSQVQINEALNIDRKTIRKYLAPALAEGLAPCPAEFDEGVWRAEDILRQELVTAMEPEQFDKLMSSLDVADDAPRLAAAARKAAVFTRR